jgi:hypothetical protein
MKSHIYKLLHAEKFFLCVSIAMCKISPFETPPLSTFMVNGNFSGDLLEYTLHSTFYILSFPYETEDEDHLCGLVVRVPGYRSRGPGSIPSATRFSQK